MAVVAELQCLVRQYAGPADPASGVAAVNWCFAVTAATKLEWPRHRKYALRMLFSSELVVAAVPPIRYGQLQPRLQAQPGFRRRPS